MARYTHDVIPQTEAPAGFLLIPELPWMVVVRNVETREIITGAAEFASRRGAEGYAKRINAKSAREDAADRATAAWVASLAA